MQDGYFLLFELKNIRIDSNIYLKIISILYFLMSITETCLAENKSK
jgi:hypothetical protein